MCKKCKKVKEKSQMLFPLYIMAENLSGYPVPFTKQNKTTWKVEPHARPGSEVIKLFSCSAQLSMKFVLLMNPKLLTIANYSLLNRAEHENFSAYKYENANYCWHFHAY